MLLNLDLMNSVKVVHSNLLLHFINRKMKPRRNFAKCGLNLTVCPSSLIYNLFQYAN